MPVDAGLDRPHLHVVDADGVLMVRVARQPGDDGGGARNVARLDVRGTQRDVLADHHRAGRVARRAPVRSDGPHADAVGLRRTGQWLEQTARKELII